MNRFLAIAVGGLLILGCHGSDGGDDDDDSSGFTPGPGGGPPGSVGQTQFLEDFEGGFPASNWTLVSGAPVVVGDQGQAPPALLIGAMNEPVLFRTPFAFSSSGAFTLSFDL